MVCALVDSLDRCGWQQGACHAPLQIPLIFEDFSRFMVFEQLTG
jgi:hypothetical protein